MNNDTERQGILSLDDIERRTNVGALRSSYLIIACGVVCGLAAIPLSGRASLAMLLVVVATGTCAWGLFRLFARQTHFVYKPTASPLRLRTYYFNRSDEGALRRFLADGFATGGDASTLPLPKPDPNGGLKLEVALSRDKHFVAAQLSAYADLLYHPLSDVVRATEAQAASLIDRLALLR